MKLPRLKPLDPNTLVPLGKLVVDPSGQKWRVAGVSYDGYERTYMTILDSDERCVSLFGEEIEEWPHG